MDSAVFLSHIDLALLTAGAGDTGQFFHLRLGGGGERGNGETHVPQQLGNQAGLVAEQCQQQVRLLDLLVTIFRGQTLGGLDGLQRFLGVFLCIHKKHSFQGAAFCLSSV